MLHHRAGGTVEVLDDVQRSGNIFQIRLGKTVLAVFERLHIHDGAGPSFRTVERGRLMGVRSVTQIVGFHISASADLNRLRKISDVLGQIGIAFQFCHFLFSPNL